MRAEPIEPNALHAKPKVQPPAKRHESMHVSLLLPFVVLGEEQLTEGADGTASVATSRWSASLHRFTTVPTALQAYSAGVVPPGSGPETSMGRRQTPVPSQLQAGR